MTACLVMLGLLMGCGGGDPEPMSRPAGAATPTPGTPVMAPPSLVAREADAWLGEDKARHMGMSFAATLFLYGAGRAALDHEAALPVAAAGSALAGVGKEVADARRGGRFSLRDLAWDAVGVGIGILLAERIE